MGTILPDLTAMTREQLMEKIEQLQRSHDKRLMCRVSEKTGVLCVYGLGRIPVSLYASQWLRVIDFAPEIVGFIRAHKDELAWKDGKKP